MPIKIPAAITALLLLFTCSLFAQSNETLQLHPENPHYFLYQHKPTIMVGSGEHYGAVVNLDFDYKTYLQALAKDNLNNTRLFTGAYLEKLGDFGIQKNTLAPAEGRAILPWKRSDTPGYTLGGNKFDLNQWDEAYFTRLKDFMAQAQRNGVIVEVTLFSAHYAAGWNYSPFHPGNNVNQTDSVPSALVNTLENGNLLEHQERYVRKIVRELNSFDNLYFEIQNEPWAEQPDLVMNRNEYGSPEDWRMQLQVVSQRSNDWQRQVAQWIKDEESNLPNQHLLKSFFEGLNFVSLQPDHSVVTASPGAMTVALSDGQTQWVIYLEPMAVSSYPLTLNLPNGSYQAEWTDVVTGQTVETIEVMNRKLAVPEGSGDKVVVISRTPGKK